MGPRRRSAFVTAAVAAGLTVAIGLWSRSIEAQRPASLQTLGVPAASNSTPSLAAAGRTVAVVWTAAKEGTSNVYLAVSSDGGATFSAPRRVNDQEGDAGATNKQPPRVVISGAGGGSVITVLWSKRDPSPQQSRPDIIRVARSADGGRTCSPARFAHDPAFSGARGLQSLTPGPDGTLHAVWLVSRQNILA